MKKNVLFLSSLFLIFNLLIVNSYCLININTADVDELTKLPKIGKKTAQNIVDYRKANGPFKSIEDLSNIKGIGKKTVERLRKLVTLSGKSTKSKPKSKPKSRKSKRNKKFQKSSNDNVETVVKTEIVYQFPKEYQELKCYSCSKKFCVKKSLHEGFCPYCGVRWKSEDTE